MLGLKHNVNVLVEYDPEWPLEFASERERVGMGHVALSAHAAFPSAGEISFMRLNPYNRGNKFENRRRVDEAALREMSMRTLITAVVSTLAIMVINGEDAKSD
jgi:hypothetical protein